MQVDWNDEKITLLKELWISGISITKIASQMGCSRNAVVGKAHRLKLKPRAVGTPRKRKWVMPKEPVSVDATPLTSAAPSTDATAWIPFLESNRFTCRAIMGNSDDDGLVLWCPNRKAIEVSYCPYHLGLYYQKTNSRIRF